MAGTTPSRPAASRSTGGDETGAGRGCGVVLVIAIALFAIGKCSSNAQNDATVAEPVVGAAGTSEPARVSARKLNCRAEPTSSARVVEALSRNEQVVVAERRDGWAGLTRAGGTCWVSEGFLARSAAAAAVGATQSGGTRGLLTAGSAAGAYDATRAGAHHAKRRSTSHGRRGRRSRGGGSYFGGGCPCSGSQICIGPRGGRYCITSGGNKRYGV
ncbi:SH3 domain-containing protein [Sphingomonas sp. 2SG]|uniref:SH3 domain-containing protein n=1 Tax=Sphingomonas sp. 2SG TaxID=2502201 RepID=UPI001485824F|nr:SH3 domain-containing protein [Sphingomonas sp. 2SG]